MNNYKSTFPGRCQNPRVNGRTALLFRKKQNWGRGWITLPNHWLFQLFSSCLITALCSQSLPHPWKPNPTPSSVSIAGRLFKDLVGPLDSSGNGGVLHVTGQLMRSPGQELRLRRFQGLGARENAAAPCSLFGLCLWFCCLAWFWKGRAQRRVGMVSVFLVSLAADGSCVGVWEGGSEQTPLKRSLMNHEALSR